MRLITFLLFITFLHVSASGLSQKVNLTVDRTPLKKALSSLQRQTGYAFFWDEQLISNTPAITLHLKDVTLAEALDECLKNLPLAYEIKGNFVYILPRNTPKQFLLESDTTHIPIDVHGRVVDEKGQSVNGASVIIKATKKGTVTNEKGEFTLYQLIPGTQLSVSFVGLAPREFTASKQFISITLLPLVNSLQEIAVLNTGYQTLSKERATGSFSKPDMEIYQARTGTMDIIERLEGLIPGLTITHQINTSSSETYTTPLIRGSSTIQLTTQPLYVVNGVIATDFNAINPNDVEDITVLKDAAAAAIWGARAANGVIVVNTRSGEKNRRLKVSYSGFLNFMGKPDFGYGNMLNSKQFIQAQKETFDPVTYPFASLSNSVVTPSELILYKQNLGQISDAQANASLDSLSAIDNTGQIKDLFFRNAYTSNHTLSVAGGTGLYSFYGSLAYTRTYSNHPGDNNNNYGINFSQDVSPGKNLKISLTTAITNAQSSRNRTISISNNFLPYQLFKNAAGQSISMPWLQGLTDATRMDYEQRSQVSLDYNPIEEANYGSTKVNNLSINMTGNIWLKLLPGLSFHGTYGYSKAPSTTTSYDDHQEYNLRRQLVQLTQAPTASSVPIYYFPTTGGTYATTNAEQRNYTIRNQLEYSYTGRGEKDRLTLQAGQEANEQYGTTSTTTVYGYDQNLQSYTILDYATLSNGIPNTVDPQGGYFYGTAPYSTYETKARATAYFALGNYTLDDKYSLDGSWRLDHSSLIGTDKSSQNRPIWSVGGKWMMSRERFMKSAKWVDNLGLRATYGITGNSPAPGTSATRNILATQVGYFGATYIGGPALLLNTPPNRKLSWESTETINLGLDFSILRSVVSGSIDLYHKKTTDLLGNANADPFTGFSSYLANIGDLDNRGIELNIRTANITTKQFRWSTQFIFSYNRNKLVSYEVPTAGDSTAEGKLYSYARIGYSLSPVFAYHFAGLDNMGDPQIRLADGTVTKTPYAATSANDIRYMGTSQPKFNGGLTNTFQYKEFGLTINIIYNLGNVMGSDINNFFTGRLTTNGPGSFGGNIPAAFANRWKQPGDEAHTNIPSYVADQYTSYSRRDVTYYTSGDINVISAAYAKVRDMTFSYALPAEVLRNLHVTNVSFNLQATNFLLWTANHEGIDPEFQPGNGVRVPLPFKHSYSMGINVGF